MNTSGRLRAAVWSLGCKVNSYETQGMTELLQQAGCEIVSIDEVADVYLINTCTVTQIAARKSRQVIHRIRTRSPQAMLIAAGCYVEKNTELLDEGVVDLIIPNRRKKDLIPLIEAYQKGLDARAALQQVEPAEQDLWITAHEGKTRAFLKVQDGCRQFCSYCIIPYVRGPLQSKPLADCVNEATGLAERGYSEIVLTGIHLSSYGRESGEDLGDLILAINRIPQVKRIRLGSMEPRMINEEFIQKIGQAEKLCPHFHLSLQSGCDNTLKSMNRRYTTEEYAHAVELLRELYGQVALTTDVIVGFPGENEEDFEASLTFVKRIAFAQVHVFRYSMREGTVAARRPDQVAGLVKKQRSERMLTVTHALTADYAKQHVGQTVEVLLEEIDKESGVWMGYTRDYLRVGVASAADLQGQYVQVYLEEWQDNDQYIRGRVINQ